MKFLDRPVAPLIVCLAFIIVSFTGCIGLTELGDRRASNMNFEVIKMQQHEISLIVEHLKTTEARLDELEKHH